MLASGACRSCILALLLSALLPLTNVGAQSADEPPPAPPMFSDRTHEQVEQFLALAPTDGAPGAKPGLRVFTISRIEPGDLLALLVAGCASLFLVAPGAFLIYSSLEPASPNWQLIGKGAAVLAVLSLAWVLVLYSFAFARNAHSYDVLEKEIEVLDRATAPGSVFIGDLSRAGLRGLNSHWTAGKLRYPLRRMGDRVPEMHFMMFQMLLFLQAVVPLLVVTSRTLRPGSHLLFWLLWSTLVYAPVTYWTQGGGWLGECVDAGSSAPLYICVGFTALGLALLQRPTSEPLAGWDGPALLPKPAQLAIGGLLFVSGSLLLSGGRSVVLHPWATFDGLNVFLAAGVGLLTWWALEKRARGTDHSAPLFGAVSGIAAIAAGCSSVSPVFAILIAALGAACSYGVLPIFNARTNPSGWRLFAVHGVSALVGLVLTGVFASADIAGTDSSGQPIVGLLSGNLELWRVQCLTGAIAAGLALVAGLALPKIAEIPGLLSRCDARAEATAEHRVDEPFVALTEK